MARNLDRRNKALAAGRAKGGEKSSCGGQRWVEIPSFARVFNRGLLGFLGFSRVFKVISDLGFLKIFGLAFI